MICPRLHSSAGQTLSSLCLHLPLVGSRSAGPEPQRPEGWASVLPPACQRPAHRSEPGTLPGRRGGGEGGSLDLESAPMGPWGPAGLSLAWGLWALAWQG